MIHDFDKQVPIPTSVERPGVNIDMLRAMAVGDSKWWPEEDAKKATRFYRVAKKLNVPIIIRKVGIADPRGPGVRMWRVDPNAVEQAQMDAIARSEAKAVAKAATGNKAPRVKGTRSKPPKTPVANDSGLEPAKPKRDRSKEPSTKARKVGARKVKRAVPSTPAFLKKQAEAAARAAAK